MRGRGGIRWDSELAVAVRMCDVDLTYEKEIAK